jgi:hypothetical protein
LTTFTHENIQCEGIRMDIIITFHDPPVKSDLYYWPAGTDRHKWTRRLMLKLRDGQWELAAPASVSTLPDRVVEVFFDDWRKYLHNLMLEA